MKRTIYYFLGSTLMLLTSCVVGEQDLNAPRTSDEQGYDIELYVGEGGNPGVSGVGLSRAGDANDPFTVRPWTTTKLPYRNPPSGNVEYLRRGTTVRVLAFQKDASGMLQQKQNMIFRVKGSTVDNTAYLSPITIDAQGDTIETTPMKLPPGDYLFYAFSPALPCGTYGEVNIDNGREFLSNDWRFAKTVPLMVSLPSLSGGSKPMRVTLNPLFNQMSRVTLSLYTLNLFVSTVDLVNAGVTMDGLQNPKQYAAGTKTVDEKPYQLREHTVSLFDTIQSSWIKHMGHLNITNKFQSMATVNTGSGSVTIPTFNVQTYILPTESSSNPILVSFNGKVNGVPASFTYSLTEKTYRPGYYYNYLGKLSLQSGVFTAEWQFVNWSETAVIHDPQ